MPNIFLNYLTTNIFSLYCALRVSNVKISQEFWVQRNGRLYLVLFFYKRGNLYIGIH
jgi:hypothetical protein